ncbi:MAG TPA: class I SAM-dependent methyltransferase, partial [Candidatus Nitrosotenuis sp.]|nr:class I SAM-dependent methyltransferase [Candidatus Nitrosotenuis sp.]
MSDSSKSKRPRLPEEWMPQKKDFDTMQRVYDFAIFCGTDRRGYAHADIPKGVHQKGRKLIEDQISNDLANNQIKTPFHELPLKNLRVLFNRGILRDSYEAEVIVKDKTYYCLTTGLKSYFENLWSKHILGPLREVLDTDTVMGQTEGGFGNIMYYPTLIIKVLLDSLSSDADVLEIGAARGIQTFQMLQRGAKVTAVDLSKKDLKILKNSIPDDYKDNLQTIVAKFPHDPALISRAWGEKFDIILISHVAHYLTGPELRDGIEQIFAWLKPGGILYFQSLTPYSNPYKWRLFIADQRQVDGHEWPGYFTREEKVEESRLRPDVVKMADERKIPNYGHPIHPAIIERELNRMGFKIAYLNYGSFENKLIDKQYPVPYQQLEKYVKQLINPIDLKERTKIANKLKSVPGLLTLEKNDAYTYKNA